MVSNRDGPGANVGGNSTDAEFIFKIGRFGCINDMIIDQTALI